MQKKKKNFHLSLNLLCVKYPQEKIYTSPIG